MTGRNNPYNIDRNCNRCNSLRVKGGGSSYLTISAIKEYTRSYKQVYNFMSFYSCTRDCDERTTTG